MDRDPLVGNEVIQWVIPTVFIKIQEKNVMKCKGKCPRVFWVLKVNMVFYDTFVPVSQIHIYLHMCILHCIVNEFHIGVFCQKKFENSKLETAVSVGP